MATLPVTALVLFKHGVGYFSRMGALSGTELTLAFRKDEVNDVLKSLTIADAAGGQVLGVYYSTPIDRDGRLNASAIRLSDTATMSDLLKTIRGRRLSLTLETTPGTLETVSGRMVGVDDPLTTPNKPPAKADVSGGQPVLTLLTDSGSLTLHPLTALRSIRIEDAQAEQDLQYFLDTSQGDEARRTIGVRLTEGEHRLMVNYVAPSPSWRVSYRVIGNSEPDSQSGQALLQGWGLFDNQLEEDLEDVQVTLVAGQPISFVYDLYRSHVPERSIVNDLDRIAPDPIEFLEGMVMRQLGPTDDTPRSAYLQRSEKQKSVPTWLTDANPSAPGEGISHTTPVGASGQEAGAFFEYKVTSPVSVKRGGSALVPILSSELPYRRELLYNGMKVPHHPVVALRFTNNSGLTLERGPVTVIEDGTYKGEAIVPFAKNGGEVYLPYAVELGVRVIERHESRTETAALHVERALLLIEEYAVHTVTYGLENTTANPVSVLIEAAIETGYELFDTPPAVSETLTERRWQVSVPARGKAEFMRSQRRPVQRHEELLKLDYQLLQDFLRKRWLDQATYDRLKGLRDQLGLIETARAQIAMLADERKSLFEQQEQLRANLGSLNATGQEADLRKRMLDNLAATQNRLEEIEQQSKSLGRDIADLEKKILQIQASLS